MAVDESFKRPGSVPFKWEVQPGIPKHEDPPAGDDNSTAAPGLPPPPATPRQLALPPAARVVALASSRSPSSVSSSAATLLSPPTSHHRRSMSARFATSLALPFTRRGRAAVKDDSVDFCVLYSDKIA